MLLSQSHHRLFLSTSPFSPSHHLPSPLFGSPLISLRTPIPLASLRRSGLDSVRETATAVAVAEEEEEADGPIELPPPSASSSSIFATTDDPTPIQVATSVLLTGAISVFLFRSIRRRARRAKELKFRSSGAKKSLKEEALENLKAMGSASIEAKSEPSAVQALLGAVAAGVITLILYKFTTTIEASLNRQTISDNISVRQITITIRTIINGLCYLATFVFGINSVGLLLYSGQLAINSFTDDSASSGEGKENRATEQTVSPSENTELKSSSSDQNSEE